MTEGTRRVVFLGLLATLLLAIAVRANAPGFSVDRWVLSGGGGRAAGGPFSLDGSVLQPAGIASSGSYQLQSGFWHGLALVAPPPTHGVHLPLLLKQW